MFTLSDITYIMSDLEKCKKYLRSILLASKGGVPGAQVVAKYKDIVGETVPYRKFNFASLETFLRSIPDVCKITVRGGEVIVVGVETPETKHIKDLVQRQGGKGGSKGGGGRPAPVNVNKFYTNKPQFSQGMNTQNNFRGPGTNVRAPSFAPPPVNRQVTSQFHSKQPQRKPQPSVTPVKVTPRKVSTPPQVRPDPASQNYPVTKESVKTWSGRVRKFLEGREHGLLKTQVEKFHEKQYQEKLPDPWADIMLNFSEITMKKEQGHVVVFLAAKTVNNNNIMLMPSGAYPSDLDWPLTVTHVESTSTVWVIFGDGRKKLDNLQASLRSRHKIRNAFNGGAMPAGNYFSAQLTSGEVVRTKVVKVDRMTHRCQALLLDVGKVLDIAWTHLVPLDGDYTSFAPLAMKVIMAGVEESHDPELVELTSARLLDRQFVGTSVGKGPNDIPRVSMFQGKTDVCEDLQRELFKMKNDIKTGYSIGYTNTLQQQTKVMNGGIGVVKNLALPPTPAAEDFYDLRISHVVSPHEIYFQSYTSLPKYASMARNMDSFYSSDRDGVSECAAGMFVAVNYSGEWRRGKVVLEIVPLPGENAEVREFLVLLVDIGEHAVIRGEDIRELAPLFAQLPVQVS